VSITSIELVEAQRRGSPLPAMACGSQRGGPRGFGSMSSASRMSILREVAHRNGDQNRFIQDLGLLTRQVPRLSSVRPRKWRLE